MTSSFVPIHSSDKLPFLIGIIGPDTSCCKPSWWFCHHQLPRRCPTNNNKRVSPSSNVSFYLLVIGHPVVPMPPGKMARMTWMLAQTHKILGIQLQFGKEMKRLLVMDLHFQFATASRACRVTLQPCSPNYRPMYRTRVTSSLDNVIYWRAIEPERFLDNLNDSFHRYQSPYTNVADRSRPGSGTYSAEWPTAEYLRRQTLCLLASDPGSFWSPHGIICFTYFRGS